MKKILVCLLAVCALVCTSCKKNPAEKYVGNYNVTLSGTMSANVLNQDLSQPITQEGAFIVELDGDEGDVVISGLYNTHGHVSEDGVLTLDPQKFETSYPVNIPILGEFNLPVSLDLTFTPISEPGNTLNWVTKATGVNTFSIPAIGEVTATFDGTGTNTAVKVE